MQNAFIAVLHLSFRAFDLAVNKMGTSALAVGLGVFYFLLRLFLAYRSGGTAAMGGEWRGDAKWGVIVTASAWACVFLWFVVATIYQDHLTLQRRVQAVGELIRKSDATTAEKVEVAKRECSVKAGAVEVLQAQIRTEQATIDSCLLSIGKSNTPDALKLTVLRFLKWPDNRIDPDVSKKGTANVRNKHSSFSESPR